jgi:hypothetical protein
MQMNVLDIRVQNIQITKLHSVRNSQRNRIKLGTILCPEHEAVI